MRLLNTNKEMPKTVRETIVFSSSWGERKSSNLLDNWTSTWSARKKKNHNYYCLDHCRLEEQGYLLFLFALTALWFSHFTCKVTWHIPFEITVWLLILSPANKVQSTSFGWTLTKTTLAFSTLISQLQVKRWESQSQSWVSHYLQQEQVYQTQLQVCWLLEKVKILAFRLMPVDVFKRYYKKKEFYSTFW